jgi:hypothetical protein
MIGRKQLLAFFFTPVLHSAPVAVSFVIAEQCLWHRTCRHVRFAFRTAPPLKLLL